MQVRVRLLNNSSRPKPGAWHRAMFHGRLDGKVLVIWVPRKLIIIMSFGIIFFKTVLNPADKTPFETKPLSSVLEAVLTSTKVISLNLPGPR